MDMNDTNYTVPIAIIVGGLIVALAIYFAIAARPSIGAVAGNGNPSLIRPVDSTDHILGNPTAPIIIVEYSDFDCTFCKTFDTTLHEIIANAGATGKVAWVFRHFPLTEIHPDALKKAMAAECAAQAGGNDAFWKFASALFAHQPADTTKLGEYAKTAGVPSDAFTACYTNAVTTVEARVKADRENALAIGARGTPYSVILVAGKAPVVMDGAYSYDAVKLLIDQALER